MAWLQLTRTRGVLTVAAAAATAAIAYGLYRIVNALTKVDDEYFESLINTENPPNKKVLVVGLDGSGKTSLVQCFGKGNRDGMAYEEPHPTVGFNVKSINMGEAIFDIWDVGGSKMCRAYWNQFRDGVDAIVWVVDASDPDRISESHDAVKEFLKDEADGIPLLIVANKQDLPNAMKPKEVGKLLGIEEYSYLNIKSRDVRITGTQVPHGGTRQGVWAVYKHLLEMG